MSGDSETRPQNVALRFGIRYTGTKTLFALPTSEKQGFWQAFTDTPTPQNPSNTSKITATYSSSIYTVSWAGLNLTSTPVYTITSHDSSYKAAIISPTATGCMVYMRNTTTDALGQAGFTITLTKSGADERGEQMYIADQMTSSVMRVYRNAAWSHTAGSGAYETVPFDTVDFKTGEGTFNTTTGEYTVTKKGYYRVKAFAMFSDIATGNKVIGKIVTTSGDRVTSIAQAAITDSISAESESIFELNVGDTIHFEAYQNDTASEAIVVGSTYSSMEIEQIN